MDESGQSRFEQPGAKLVPGAGVRWQPCGSAPPASNALDLRAGEHAVSATDASPSDGPAARYDELPWQVIAILDRDTLAQVCAGADAHRQRMRVEAEAKAAHAGLRAGCSDSDCAGGGTSGAAAAPAADASSSDGSKEELDALANEADHYVVLCVASDASEKQIVQAYRMASLRYHPDRRGGSTAAFQRVQLAYHTLSDEERRRTYDAGEQASSGGDGSSGSAYDERWRRQYCPFGDPFVHRRKLEEQRRREEARASREARSRGGGTTRK